MCKYSSIKKLWSNKDTQVYMSICYIPDTSDYLLGDCYIVKWRKIKAIYKIVCI